MEKFSTSDWAVVIGWNLGKMEDESLAWSWLYKANPKLENISPKDYLDKVDDGEKVAKVFATDFATEINIPDFARK